MIYCIESLKDPKVVKGDCTKCNYHKDDECKFKYEENKEDNSE